MESVRTMAGGALVAAAALLAVGAAATAQGPAAPPPGALERMAPGLKDELTTAAGGPLDARRPLRVEYPGPPAGGSVDESKVQVVLHVDAGHADASDDPANPGTDAARPIRSLPRGWELAKAALAAGKGAKLVIHPGRYVLRQKLELLGDSTTADPVLVVEGTEPGKVILSGAVSEGWEPATWKLIDAQRKIYAHPWPYRWPMRSSGYYFPKTALDCRDEMLLVNGQMLAHRPLELFSIYNSVEGFSEEEDIGLVTGKASKKKGPPPADLFMPYTHKGAKGGVTAEMGFIYRGHREPTELAPGEFAVFLMGPGDAAFDARPHPYPKTIFLRLPQGLASIDEARIELPLAESLMRVAQKSNFVLRNLVLEHAKGTAFYTYGIPWVPTKHGQWLIERCEFRGNGGTGLNLNRALKDFTVRDCRMYANDGVGLNVFNVFGGRFENCDIFDNARYYRRIGQRPRHGSGGCDFNAEHILFQGCRFRENYGDGFRADAAGNFVWFEDCELRDNQYSGVFIEISWGPVWLRRTRLVGNRGAGLSLLNVHDVSLEGCTIADNQGPQISFYNWAARSTRTDVSIAPRDAPTAPIRMCLNFTIRDSTVRASRPEMGNLYDCPGGGTDRLYRYMIETEFRGSGNRYGHARGEKAFDISPTRDRSKAVLADLAGWRQVTGQDVDATWIPAQP